MLLVVVILYIYIYVRISGAEMYNSSISSTNGHALNKVDREGERGGIKIRGNFEK